MRKTKIAEKSGVRGFFRIAITEDENGVNKVVGDSGYKENQITNQGKVNFLAEALGSISGSSYIGWAALGTGTVVNPASTALPGELTGNASLRMAVTPATTTYSGSSGVQFAFTLTSGNTAGTGTIQNVGLFANSVTSAGTIFAGNTYTTSALASNQAKLFMALRSVMVYSKLCKLQETLYETICSEISKVRETFNDYNQRLQLVGGWNSLTPIVI